MKTYNTIKQLFPESSLGKSCLAKKTVFIDSCNLLYKHNIENNTYNK